MECGLQMAPASRCLATAVPSNAWGLQGLLPSLPVPLPGGISALGPVRRGVGWERPCREPVPGAGAEEMRPPSQPRPQGSRPPSAARSAWCISLRK